MAHYMCVDDGCMCVYSLTQLRIRRREPDRWEPESRWRRRVGVMRNCGRLWRQLEVGCRLVTVRYTHDVAPPTVPKKRKRELPQKAARPRKKRTSKSVKTV